MHHTAFTLLELIVCLCVLAVLLLLAVPSGYDFLSRNRSSLVVNQLIATLNFARHEAIRTGQTITWCATKDLQHCGGDWSVQQMVFVDNNATHQRGSKDQLLRVIGSLSGKGHLSWRGFRSRDYLQVTSYGLGMTMNGRFQYYPANHDGRYARTLLVNRLGRARLS